MSQFIIVHSFRRAAGKSSLVANLCALLAGQGQRVAAVDIDFEAPSLHLFFGFNGDAIPYTLNDYFWGKCKIEDAAYEITSQLDQAATGKLFLVPASLDINDIVKMLRTRHDLDLLNEGLQQLVQSLNLDYLVMDTTAGLNEDTLLAIALSNVLIVLLQPDPQDYQGGAVTIEVARNLAVQRLFVILNDAPDTLDPEQACQELEKTYRSEAAILLPHSDHLQTLASGKLLALVNPNDPYIAQLHMLVKHLGTGS
jgi:MinD-like ATPase involved in chromosome partitioning or flagellar assembly